PRRCSRSFSGTVLRKRAAGAFDVENADEIREENGCAGASAAERRDLRPPVARWRLLRRRLGVVIIRQPPGPTKGGHGKLRPLPPAAETTG
ncbi:unnamed protein product, partial [Amoebophrya sp. A120]